MKEYLKVIFETEEKDYFCIWQTDLNSGFYKDGDHVACFRDEGVFDAYAAAKGIRLKETVMFDLASLMSFAGGLTDEFDPSTLLNFWNISSDLAFTLGVSFLGDDDNEALSEIYDTLFFLTSADEPEGEMPSLSPDDIADLRSVIADGCKLIVTNLTAV